MSNGTVKGMKTNLIRGVCSLDERRLEPTANKVNGGSRVEAQQCIGWEHEAFLFVLLQREDTQPYVEWQKAEAQEGEW